MACLFLCRMQFVLLAVALQSVAKVSVRMLLLSSVSFSADPGSNLDCCSRRRNYLWLIECRLEPDQDWRRSSLLSVSIV